MKSTLRNTTPTRRFGSGPAGRLAAKRLRESRSHPVLERLEDRTLLSAGALDPTFGSGGIAVTSFIGNDSQPEAVALQADGKIVVVGWSPSTASGDGRSFALARFNADGSLDPAFGPAGKVITDVPGNAFAEAFAGQVLNRSVA